MFVCAKNLHFKTAPIWSQTIVRTTNCAALCLRSWALTDQNTMIFRKRKERLAEIGYIHEGDLGIKDRDAFKYTDKPHLMAHHLYVCPLYSAELHRHIVFRDFLRKNPDAVKKYSEVKERAAELFPLDIDKYIEYKSPCIEELYSACGIKQR